MAAPGGIEFNEDLLFVAHDEFLPLLSNNDLDGLVVRFRDGCRFEVGLNFSGGDSFSEGFEVFKGDFIVVVVVLDCLAVEVDQLGGAVNVNAHVFSQPFEEPMPIVLGGNCQDE